MAEVRAFRAERQPLFESVGAALKHEIASGRFARADVLPGERELSQMLEVSRTTLRRAIAALVEEGVLVHRHGAGTFVRRSPPHVEQPLSRLTSFTEDMRLRGLAASSRVIERGLFLPTPEESMMLDIKLSETVFRLSRLRLADGAPMAIERAAVPMRFLGVAERVGPSLYAALEAGGPSAGARRPAAEGGAGRRRPRRRCSRSPRARPRSTSIASPMSPTGAASSSPARPIGPTPTISSPN